MATTPRIAPRVLDRDGYECVYCGQELTDDVGMTVDHVVPRSWFERGEAAGDADGAANLVCCCGQCNSLKRDLNLDLFAEYLRLGHGWTADDAAAMKRRVRAALRRKLPA